MVPVVTAMQGLGCLPSVPPEAGGAVTPCVDAVADLLAKLFGMLAALISPGLPDVAGALTQITGLLTTLTKLITEKCLPVPVPVPPVPGVAKKDRSRDGSAQPERRAGPPPRRLRPSGAVMRPGPVSVGSGFGSGRFRYRAAAAFARGERGDGMLGYASALSQMDSTCGSST